MKLEQKSFLTAILGEDGAEALNKAIDRCNSFESVLIPRSILSWINVVTPFGHEGEIPGVPDSFIKFNKNETGYHGEVSIGDYSHNFENGTLFHLASALSLSLGVEVSNDINVKNMDIERLGKTVDLLVKSKIIKDELAKARVQPKAAETPGGADGGQPPIPAHEPVAEAPKAVKTTEKPTMPKAAKLPKVTRLKIAKNEFSHKCGLCGKSSFLDSIFIGCSCLRSLAKSTKTDIDTDTVTLGVDWDSDAVLTLFECIGRTHG